MYVEDLCLFLNISVYVNMTKPNVVVSNVPCMRLRLLYRIQFSNDLRIGLFGNHIDVNTGEWVYPEAGIG